MGLKQEIEKLKLDKRLVDWHLSHGKLAKSEYEQYLAALPDLASNVDTFSLGDEQGDSLSGGFGDTSSNGSSGFGGQQGY